MIKYLYHQKNSDSLVIVSAHKPQQVILKRSTTKELFKRMCLEHGCSLEGRLDYYRKKYKARQHIPIIISSNKKSVMVPVSAGNYIYNFNYKYFKKTVDVDNHFCYIYFTDGSYIILAVSKRNVDNQIRRAKRALSDITIAEAENELSFL